MHHLPNQWVQIPNIHPRFFIKTHRYFIEISDGPTLSGKPMIVPFGFLLMEDAVLPIPWRQVIYLPTLILPVCLWITIDIWGVGRLIIDAATFAFGVSSDLLAPMEDKEPTSQAALDAVKKYAHL
jgi:hypothetical protein